MVQVHTTPLSSSLSLSGLPLVRCFCFRETHIIQDQYIKAVQLNAPPHCHPWQKPSRNPPLCVELDLYIGQTAGLLLSTDVEEEKKKNHSRHSVLPVTKPERSWPHFFFFVFLCFQPHSLSSCLRGPLDYYNDDDDKVYMNHHHIKRLFLIQSDSWRKEIVRQGQTAKRGRLLRVEII